MFLFPLFYQSRTEVDNYSVVITNLTKRFGNFTAVDQLNLKVEKGEIFGFLGPNGSGKSTTIRMLCGILNPTSGTAIVAGLDLATQAEKIKSNIGYMSQKFSLYDDLTVEQNLDFYAGIYKVELQKKEERKNWVIRMANLEEQKERVTGTLPVGWKQRLAFGCSILHEPSIVFLDEPTSGVDPLSRRDFWNLIQELAVNGMTVFVTTHYMDEAEYCDHLGLIYTGKLIALGTPEDLKTKYFEGKLIELVCPRPADALEQITKVKGVRDAALFGSSIHIVVDAAEIVEEIRKTLVAEKFTIEEMEIITPSLEDVFVSLIQGMRGNS